MAVDACHNLIDYLAGRELRNAVNVAAIDFAAIGDLKPYAEMGHRMGVILAAMMHGRLKRLVITYAGEIAKDPSRLISISVVMGMLRRVSSTPLNMVNAMVVAKEEGLEIVETARPDAGGYVSLVRVTGEGERESHSVQGTVFHKSSPRVTALDDFVMELKPEGDLVICFNADRPGVIGEVGSIFGTLSINIASMTFGRKLDTQEACLALTLDAVPPPNLLEELRGKDFMQRVHHVSLPPLVTESA